MKLYEEFKEYEKLWDNLVEWKAIQTGTNTSPNTTAATTTSKSNTQEILGCNLEETIDNMSNYGRFPRIPLFWLIDDIDDSDTESRIMFHAESFLSVFKSGLSIIMKTAIGVIVIISLITKLVLMMKCGSIQKKNLTLILKV